MLNKSYFRHCVEDGARLDVAANGFWEYDQKAYLMSRCLVLLLPLFSISTPVLQACGAREDKERIQEAEHGIFSP